MSYIISFEMNIFRKKVFSKLWSQYYRVSENAIFIRSYSSTCTCARLSFKNHYYNQTMRNSAVNVNIRYFMSPTKRAVKNALDFVYRKLLFVDQNKQKLSGIAWYRTLDEVNFNNFIMLLDLPDTFQSWFKVVQLHVWMILVRLAESKGENSIIRSTVIEAMWHDVEERAKLIEPLNINFKKNMRALTDDFRMCLFILDEGYLNNDITLANALWNQIFMQSCNDPKKLEGLVSFVRHQLKYLETVSVVLDKNGEIKGPIWTELKPHLEK